MLNAAQHSTTLKSHDMKCHKIVTLHV